MMLKLSYGTLNLYQKCGELDLILKKRLNSMNIYSVKELALTPKEKTYKGIRCFR